eukprot:2437601-Lingulodinium_polyedra.AAC.1
MSARRLARARWSTSILVCVVYRVVVNIGCASHATGGEQERRNLTVVAALWGAIPLRRRPRSLRC